MDLNKIISELLEERQRLDRLVASLEQIEAELPHSKVARESRRGRKSMDAEGRAAVSERMKKYWENRRKNGASS